MANYKIEDIEGIGPAYGEKLRAASIEDTDTLLERCKTPAGRKEVEAASGITGTLILKWANMADLYRVSGVGSEYSELLEAAGVDTVKELRHRNAENLAEKMAEVNDEKKLTRRVPSAETCTKWVEEAKALPPMMEY